MSTLAQKSIKAVIDGATPAEHYTLAVTVRDAYKKEVRDNGAVLNPKLMRVMNKNVEFYRQQLN